MDRISAALMVPSGEWTFKILKARFMINEISIIEVIEGVATALNVLYYNIVCVIN